MLHHSGGLVVSFINENLGSCAPVARICLLENTMLEQLADLPLPCVAHCG